LAVFVVLFMKTIARKILSAHYTGMRDQLSQVFTDARTAEEAERTEVEETLDAAKKKLRATKK